ncbi:MAG: nucleotide sugar dehydrogenase [Thermoplasmata archaeon]|nr:MAG: nucleotide sugar dehydrogenase [Thermoplasmata archaeon]
MFNKIAVIGMGYVGIPAAAVFAEAGLEVIGVQRRSERSGWKIDYINSGKSPIKGKEPLLAEMIEAVVKAGKLKVTDDFSVCSEVEAILITVQTPTDENNVPQYKSLREVCKIIGPHLRKGVLVCNESTIAPGTMENIVRPILEEHSGLKAGEDFLLAYSYERVMVGRLVWNIKNYPRIIGGINQASADRAEELYRYTTDQPLYKTDCMTAEVAKTVENTYRDINIAFANEVALISESLGVNAYEVRQLVNTLPKDSNAYRNLHLPGAGVGGHCLPKDPWLLKWGLDQYGTKPFEPKLIIRAREVNASMPNHVIDLIISAFEQNNVKMADAKIVLMGLAFLENTDDTRNSPTIPLQDGLKDKGAAEIVVHDPFVDAYEGVNLTNDLQSALEGADCAVIVVKHDEYKDLDLKEVKTKMRTPILIDGRNLYERVVVEGSALFYSAVGKGEGK